MDISDNILRDRLQHVYWIIGTSCSGKSTMAKALADKHGLRYYDPNDHYPRLKAAASPTEQPYLSRTFRDADAYFSLPLPEYVEHLEKQTEEAFEMMVVDFLEMGADTPIITEEIHITELALRVSAWHKVAFLFTDEALYRQQNWERDDQERRDIRAYMETTSDPDKHLAHVTEMGVLSGERMIRTARRLKVAMFQRVKSTTVAQMLEKLEDHFGFSQTRQQPD